MADFYMFPDPKVAERVVWWNDTLRKYFAQVVPSGTYTGEQVLDQMYAVWVTAAEAHDSGTFSQWRELFTELYVGKGPRQ